MRALVAGGHVGSGPGTTATKGFAPSSSKTSKTGDGYGDANRRARAGHVLVEWQQVANLVWSYAKLRTMPDAATLGAIRDAAARLALEKPTERPRGREHAPLGARHAGDAGRAPERVRAREVADADVSDAADRDRDRDRDPDPDPALSALFSALGHADASAGRADQRALRSAARGVGDLCFLPVGAHARMWRGSRPDAGDFATEDGVLIAHHAAVTHTPLSPSRTTKTRGARRARRSRRAPRDAAEPSRRATRLASAERQHARDDAVSSSQRRVGRCYDARESSTNRSASFSADMVFSRRRRRLIFHSRTRPAGDDGRTTSTRARRTPTRAVLPRDPRLCHLVAGHEARRETTARRERRRRRDARRPGRDPQRQHASARRAVV